MTQVFQTQSLPGRTMFAADGTEYTYFGGTDYLGMGRNEEFLMHLNEGFRLWGTHFGSSRNNSLQLKIYNQAETALAHYTDAPAALIVSSGMWAGQLLMRSFPEIVGMDRRYNGTQYHYAPRVHPALWGIDFTSFRKDWSSWTEGVRGALKERPDICHIVCTDAVGSPWVEDLNLMELAKADSENLWLVVDDSHGLGVKGNDGGGCFFDLAAAMRRGQLIVVSSLNKGLGVPGGAILAESRVLEVLRRSPWFAGASPPPPPYMYTLEKMINDKGFKIANSTLKANISYFNEMVPGTAHFASIPNYPVYCSRETRLYDHLLAHSIMSSCFSYPSSSDSPVTRLAINALHTKKDLDLLAEVCMKF